jgi:hypothetical protein
LESGEESTGSVVEVNGAADRVRIRRPSIVAAPLFIVAVAAFGAGVASASWVAWDATNRTGAWWVWPLAPCAVGVGALVLARGCFVDVQPGGPDARVIDVVAWRRRLEVPLEQVAQARVQRGIWRLFVLIRHDGTTVSLLGSSPAQWPARLTASSRAQDVEDLERLLGERDGAGPMPTTA